MPWILNFKNGVLNGVFEFQEFIGDHFLIDVKRNGDHFGVDLRGVDLRIISGLGIISGAIHIIWESPEILHNSPRLSCRSPNHPDKIPF